MRKVDGGQEINLASLDSDVDLVGHLQDHMCRLRCVFPTCRMGSVEDETANTVVK